MYKCVSREMSCCGDRSSQLSAAQRACPPSAVQTGLTGRHTGLSTIVHTVSSLSSRPSDTPLCAGGQAAVISGQNWRGGGERPAGQDRSPQYPACDVGRPVSCCHHCSPDTQNCGPCRVTELPHCCLHSCLLRTPTRTAASQCRPYNLVYWFRGSLLTANLK